MNPTSYLEEYKTLLKPDVMVSSRARSKVKSYPYPFRDATDFLITNHARTRMEQRDVSIEDISLILQHGRALLQQKDNKSMVLIFLCSGELPKGKAEEKAFEKLWGIVLVTTLYEPVLITVLTDCFRWRNHIFQKPSLPGKPTYQEQEV
jgi:hypothetical protein